MNLFDMQRVEVLLGSRDQSIYFGDPLTYGISARINFDRARA